MDPGLVLGACIRKKTSRTWPKQILISPWITRAVDQPSPAARGFSLLHLCDQLPDNWALEVVDHMLFFKKKKVGPGWNIRPHVLLTEHSYMCPSWSANNLQVCLTSKPFLFDIKCHAVLIWDGHVWSPCLLPVGQNPFYIAYPW